LCFTPRESSFDDCHLHHHHEQQEEERGKKKADKAIAKEGTADADYLR